VPTTDYPLEALLRLREQIRDGRAQLLAGAVAALERAEAVRELAGRRVEEARGKLARAREDLVAGGGRTAGELRRRELYVDRLERALGASREAEAGARRARDEARGACDVAREELARAEADLKLVEGNREAWEGARREREQRRAEEELEEIAAARYVRERQARER
jgi:hypothetical protein